MRMLFPGWFPYGPPTCYFAPKFPHVNVGTTGKICLPMLSESLWKPSTSITEILFGLYRLFFFNF